MADIRALASERFRGRGSATDDEKSAADYLTSRFDAIGLDRIGGLRVQTFATRGNASSQNVFGAVRSASAGSLAGTLVVGAHYDHLGVREGKTFPGADDNASGVAVLLGIAQKMTTEKPALRRNVAFVLFGSEEIGLKGSAAFVRSGPMKTSDMFAMVNIDMLGSPLADRYPVAIRLLGIDPEKSIGVDGVDERPGFLRAIQSACDASAHRAVTIDSLPEVIRDEVRRQSAGRSDDWSFEKAKVPAVFFSSAESRNYHLPSDTADRVNADLVAVRAKVVYDAVIALANLESPDK